MKRVIVVGAPGTGKSTFSRKLTKKTGLPLIHLDYYFHQKGYEYYLAHKDDWLKKYKDLTKGDRWVVDGNYLLPENEKFRRADTVIFLDYPRRVYFWRILKRQTIYRKRDRKDMPDEWREKFEKNFLKYVWTFKSKHRDKLVDLLSRYTKDKKLIVFKKPTDAQKYLESLR